MKLMLDLFSGLGGASESMMQSESWEVQRIENNPLLFDVENTTTLDVEKFLEDYQELIDQGWTPNKLDLLWASPPCTEFSTGFSAPGPTAKRSGVVFVPCLKLVEITLEIIQLLKPKYWCIENVKGSIPHFAKLGLKPRQIVGPFVLYGNFPLLHIDNNFNHNKYNHDSWSTDPLRSNKRAYVPLEISAGMKNAIESQQSILDF